MAMIKLALPDGRIRRFKLKGSPVTIGRSPEAAIRISERVISRLHAKLERDSVGRWTLTDLGSSNKTFYRDQPITSHALNDGDTFKLATITATFHDPAEQSSLSLEDTHTKPSGKPCPACGKTLAKGAMLCVACGFNVKTGKRMATQLEASGSTVDGAVPAVSTSVPAVPTMPAATSLKDSEEPSKFDYYVFRDRYAPAIMMALTVIIVLVARGPIGLVAEAIMLVPRVILLLIAMAIAAKIGAFGFGHFPSAIYKVLGIAAFLPVSPIVAGWVLGDFGTLMAVLFDFVILAGLMKLCFELDFFELFLIAITVAVVNSYLFMILVSAINSLLHISNQSGV